MNRRANRRNNNEWWFLQNRLKETALLSYLEPRYVFNRCIIDIDIENQVLIYSKQSIIKTLQTHYGWTETRAEEWIRYSIPRSKHRIIIDDKGE